MVVCVRELSDRVRVSPKKLVHFRREGKKNLIASPLLYVAVARFVQSYEPMQSKLVRRLVVGNYVI